MSHAGLALVRHLDDRTGLTGAVAGAVLAADAGARPRRVLADLRARRWCRVVSGFRVMSDPRELFGLVASMPTAWRTLMEIAGTRGTGRAGGSSRR